MPVTVVGLSHKTAPVEIRDRFVLEEAEWTEGIRIARKEGKIQEGFVLSTCNRSEIYTIGKDPQISTRAAETLLLRSQEVGADMERYLYRMSEEETARHLFRVAAGLDSMIVGEQQILGQVREFFEVAREHNLTGTVLNRLLQMAVEVGKRVRTETGISEGAVSVSFAAVELAKKIFGNLNERSAILIGAGETGELTASHLVANGVHRLLVANRTYERAARLAGRFGAEAVRFEELMERLKEVDVAISSTAASGYLVDREKMGHVMRARRNRPIFLIDIAVPRDIDPEVKGLYNVFLYDIDDLEAVVEANIRKRWREAEKAEGIVDEEVAAFFSWYNTLDVVPLVIDLRRKFQEIQEAELGRVMNKFEGLSKKDLRLIEGMMKRYMNKLLHGLTAQLKTCAGTGDGVPCAQMVRCLFDLIHEAQGQSLCPLKCTEGNDESVTEEYSCVGAGRHFDRSQVMRVT